MEFIVMIKGEVEHPLTIDPSVWIFDDRKVELDTIFDGSLENEDELTRYKKAISAQWDKEIMEGSEPPKPTSKIESTFKKQELLSKSFGMPFAPFLKSSKPKASASHVIIETKLGKEHCFPIEKAHQFILGFSDKGHPLRDDGPVHVYLGDGSNKRAPITNVSRFIVK